MILVPPACRVAIGFLTVTHRYRLFSMTQVFYCSLVGFIYTTVLRHACTACIIALTDLILHSTADSDTFFDTDFKVISVTSQSMPGSQLGTVDIYINANGSATLIVNEYIRSIHHNHSNEKFRYYPNKLPAFHLTANNTFSTRMNDYSIIFNELSLGKLRDTPSAQCTDGTTQYLILKLNLILSSDSLYHLGDHSVNMYANFGDDFIDAALSLKVQASRFRVNFLG